MSYRSQKLALLGAAFLGVSMAAFGGSFDGISACHDMGHLHDKQNADDKKARANKLDGESRTYCLWASKQFGEQVCMTGPVVNILHGDIPYTMNYKVDGKAVQTWTVSGSLVLDPYSFSVESVDLGGHGENVTIVSLDTDVSNGMGVGYTDLYIIADAGKRRLDPIQAQDYRSISGLYRVPRRKGCVLLVSKWDYDKEPGRGDGTYAIGHWYVLEDDKLVEYPGIPPMERRLLYRFWDDRWSKPLPRLWFMDKTTRLLKH